LRLQKSLSLCTEKFVPTEKLANVGVKSDDATRKAEHEVPDQAPTLCLALL
jgi:hypothetical protein